MAFVAASFLASVRSTLKKKMYFEPEWDLLFFVFFCDVLQSFCTFRSNFNFFFQKLQPFFNKITPMKKPAAFLCACIFCESFFSRSAALESFRGVFGHFVLVFSFSQILNARI